jgi:hypothetical protein
MKKLLPLNLKELKKKQIIEHYKCYFSNIQKKSCMLLLKFKDDFVKLQVVLLYHFKPF